MNAFVRYWLIGLLGWLGATVAVQALGRAETAQTLRGFWPMLSLLMVLLLWVGLVLLALLRRQRRWAALQVGALSVVILLLGLTWASRAGTWLHLQLYRQEYEATIQQLMAAPDDAARQALCGKGCWVRAAPTWQVGFPYSQFFILWSEIVYDPASELASPTQRRNALIRAQPLGDPWYSADYGD